MTLAIANNVSSLTAQNALHRSTAGLSRSLERLSSGLRVNRGADDPAALVISEKQRAQIAGLEQAIENSEKAVAVVQTAEGALSEINSLLIKIRSLALDSSNTGVNSEDALDANNQEIINALDTIDRIANNTQFGTKKLLDGSSGIAGVTSNVDVTFLRATTDTQAGVYDIAVTTAGERANVDALTQQTQPLAADERLIINGVEVLLSAGLDQVEVVNRINDYSSQTGVVADADGTGGVTRLYTVAYGADADISVTSNVANAADSSGFGTSQITATGSNVVATVDGTSYTGSGNVLTVNTGPARGLSLSFAAQTGASSHQTVTGALGNITIADNSMVFQIGPNRAQTAKVNVDRVNPEALGIGVGGNQFANLDEISVLSFNKAQDTLDIVDAAIDEITNLRGRLGAFQGNTLEATANNMRTTLENSINAESVIRDTDFAEEIANFTKHQVLVQAGTSVLSSANQTSQLVLSLLG